MTTPDKNGNSLIKEGNRIYLKLKSEQRNRLIGTVQNNELIVERVRAKHLMRKGNSYGFNEYVISHAKTFDKIRLVETNTYLIPVAFIMENGKYLFFKEQGFEVQRFVSLEQIEQFKVGARI